MFKNLALVAILSTVLAIPATAQTMNCDNELSAAKAAVGKMGNLSASQKAARLRVAQQAYDLCKAGDVDMAKEYFRMMQASSS